MYVWRQVVASKAFDLRKEKVRALNQFLHRALNGTTEVRVVNPDGAHSIAVGVDAPVKIEIEGNAGYYAAGMNKSGQVTIHGNAGPGVAEGMNLVGCTSGDSPLSPPVRQRMAACSSSMVTRRCAVASL
jgi:hypothetical protein